MATQHGGVTSFMAKALQDAGKAPGDVVVGGIDLAPSTIDGLEDGYITVTLDQQFGTQHTLGRFRLSVTEKADAKDSQADPIPANIAAILKTPADKRTPVQRAALASYYRSIDPKLREAAAMLGAGPWQVWRAVDLPIIGRAVAVGAGFAFAVSLGEFGATVFLARPDLPTVPVAISRLLGQPGDLNVGRAMALSTILMVVTAVAMLLIERVRERGVGEF